ncbi:MAG: hypothetical protein KGS72_13145 [Cyanobacteria bacterium REEB67]|nr:hypothetical protein [Cyanobacteria bacterium REEB67]
MHLKKRLGLLTLSLIAFQLLSIFQMPAIADSISDDAFKSAAATLALSPLKSGSSPYLCLNRLHRARTVPVGVEIYQYDASPLGGRQPLLFVHGLHGEFNPTLRWGKLAAFLQLDAAFRHRYKIYLARYNTHAALPSLERLFRPALLELSDRHDRRPIVIVSLSIAGNVIVGAMADALVKERVARVLALGVPAYGSPLFNADWMQFSMWTRHSWLSRIDRYLSFKLYFARHKNLLVDYQWSDLDGQKPPLVRCRFHLPLSSKLNPLADDRSLPSWYKADIKDKIWAYAGYEHSEFCGGRPPPRLLLYLTVPYSFFRTTIWTHCACEHAALRLLNHEMGEMVVDHPLNSRVGYALNDGITPVSSSLFLPVGMMSDLSIATAGDIAKLRQSITVGKARLFENIDHISFIDGYHPLASSKNVVDRLAEDEARRPIFCWLRDDLMSSPESVSGLATPLVRPND